MKPVMNWFYQRPEREQKLLVVMISLVVLTLAVLPVISLYKTSQQAQSENEQLLQNYRWLQTQTHDLQQWRATFGRASLGMASGTDELGSLLQEGLRRHRLDGSVSRATSGWQIKVQNADGNRLLGYIEAAVGTGLAPRQLQVTQQSAKGVNATLVFEAVVR